MNHVKCMLILVLITGFYYSNAQKTVSGLKFSACLNKKELPAKFYKGKFLVLDFWATWCGPCIASFPKVSALQKKYQHNPKVVFAALTPERKGIVDTFFHRKKDMMTGVLHLVDDSGATWRYFEVNFIPNIIVFAPSGKIVFSGHVEELSGCMDKLLKGKNLYKEAPQEKPVKDKWAQLQQTAAFIAIAGPADTTEAGGSNANYNSDYSTVNLRLSNESLPDVIGGFGHLTSLAIKYDDSIKANQLISLYYKQSENDFPEFDKGIFGYQYQNHILDLLEKLYSFHSTWITEQMTAYKIVVKNKQLLDKAATLSTHGSYMSTSDRVKKICTVVNQDLKSVASMAENYLNVPFSGDTAAGGFDFELEFSSFPAFEKSLAKYGLAVEKREGYEMKKLNLVFY